MKPTQMRSIVALMALAACTANTVTFACVLLSVCYTSAQALPSCHASERVICLDIPDEYEYMQSELVQLLKEKAGRFLVASNAGRLT